MRSLIVTVAGSATRFNRDTNVETLKCIYYEGNPDLCLLSKILHKSEGIDEFIIVGGYLFNDLRDFIDCHLHEYSSKIKLVFNPEYKTYGSGYSLALGILATDSLTDEIIFVEGDLSFDISDYKKVIYNDKNVISVNHELISAHKAVVVYENIQGKLRYLYDTNHNSLEINEPFMAIYNSAQIWKFKNPHRLREIVNNLTETQIKSTNLEPIQIYFGNLNKEEYNIVAFHVWHNCNTVADYRLTIKHIR